MAKHGNIMFIESDSEEEKDDETPTCSAIDDRREDTEDIEDNVYDEVAAPMEKRIQCKTMHHWLLLKSTSFGSGVYNLKVEFNERDCAIILQGPKDIVMQQSLQCLECMGKVCTSSEPVKATTLSILQRKGCIELLRQKTKDVGTDSYVYLDEDPSTNGPKLHCIAYSEENAKKALQKALSAFGRMEVPFAANCVELFMTSSWDSVTEELQESLMVAIEIVHTRSIVEVEGFQDDVTKAAGKVKETIGAYKPMKTINLTGAKARLFCKSHTLQEELLRLKEEAK
jgi:hypothetical protein